MSLMLRLRFLALIFPLCSWLSMEVGLRLFQSLHAEERAPTKYGSRAVRMHTDHSFFMKQPAPDFWALLPYYVSQQTDADCSVSCATMTLNALRAPRELRTDEELVTSELLFAKLGDQGQRWKKGVAAGGVGTSLEDFAQDLRLALPLFDLSQHQVDPVRFEKVTPESRSQLIKLLTANEVQADDVVIANVLQSELTGDPEGAVGHLLPIAAFDATTARVLLLDPDRRWYEPYWVTVDTLLTALVTTDPQTHKNRGLLHIHK